MYSIYIYAVCIIYIIYKCMYMIDMIEQRGGGGRRVTRGGLCDGRRQDKQKQKQKQKQRAEDSEKGLSTRCNLHKMHMHMSDTHLHKMHMSDRHMRDRHHERYCAARDKFVCDYRVQQAVSRPARPRYIPYAITCWGVGRRKIGAGIR